MPTVLSFYIQCALSSHYDVNSSRGSFESCHKVIAHDLLGTHQVLQSAHGF
jgi:hypothetical protein